MVYSSPVLSEIGPILPETYELMLQNSPFLFASRVTLQNTCVEERWNECSFVTELLGTLFEEHPHYYLRSLDLARNSISTQGVFHLLIALKNYPRLASISLDEDRRRFSGYVPSVHSGHDHLPCSAQNQSCGQSLLGTDVSASQGHLYDSVRAVDGYSVLSVVLRCLFRIAAKSPPNRLQLKENSDGN